MKKKTKTDMIHLKGRIEYLYGPKCKEYEDGCCICRVWFLVENLCKYLDDAEA